MFDVFNSNLITVSPNFFNQNYEKIILLNIVYYELSNYNEANK